MVFFNILDLTRVRTGHWRTIEWEEIEGEGKKNKQGEYEESNTAEREEKINIRKTKNKSNEEVEGTRKWECEEKLGGTEEKEKLRKERSVVVKFLFYE